MLNNMECCREKWDRNEDALGARCNFLKKYIKYFILMEGLKV